MRISLSSPEARKAAAARCPPPPKLVAIGNSAIEYVQQRFGTLYLARVDLLPDSDGTWLVSELELGWPELFLRSNPPVVPRVAEALMQHIGSPKDKIGTV